MNNLTNVRPLLGTLVLLTCGLLPTGILPNWPAKLHATLRNDAPNAREYAQIEHNYYERILDNPQPSRGHLAPFDPGVLAQAVADVREYVLKPSLVTTHKGARWTTNAWGMRDRPYEPAKPPGTLRIGLVGDSIAAGWGVDDGKGFEPRLEELWNDRATGTSTRVEVLNFAVPGHSPGQRWEHFARVGWAFEPDLVIVESSLADLGWDERRLRVLLPRGLGFDALVYRDVLRSSSIDPVHVDPLTLKTALHPLRTTLLAGVYRQVVADCHARGIPVVWLLLPRVGKRANPEENAVLLGLARDAGFDRIVDISRLFDGQPAGDLAIGPGDFHPNGTGHAQLATQIDLNLGDYVSSLTAQSRPIKREAASSPVPPGHAPTLQFPYPPLAGVDSR